MEAVGRSLTDAVRKMLRMPNVDERAIKELVKDLQRTLLQADVNVELVLQLSKAVEDRSIKEKLPPGINRREHVVKVLYEEMAKFVGQDPAKVEIQPGAFRKIMLVGIQGTGKTTSSVKLARFFSKRGLRVGIVCADTYRPGAYDQLLQLATKAEIPVYGEPGKKKPEDIAKHGLEHFKKEKSDLVIIDTAGRHRNEKDLMDEMKRIASAVQPDEIVLAVDATIGQQAIHQAKAFHEATPIGSVLLTKMDGSAKGGGALSAVVATGSKVKFIGSGERVDELGVDEEIITACRVIIKLKTPKEVNEPRLVDSSREKRIAHGSGRSEKEVRELVNQYFSMRKMMKQMKRRGPMMKGMPFMKK